MSETSEVTGTDPAFTTVSSSEVTSTPVPTDTSTPSETSVEA